MFMNNPSDDEEKLNIMRMDPIDIHDQNEAEAQYTSIEAKIAHAYIKDNFNFDINEVNKINRAAKTN